MAPAVPRQRALDAAGGARGGGARGPGSSAGADGMPVALVQAR